MRMSQQDRYEALYEECRLLVLSQNYEEALVKISELIEEFPDQPDPLILMANALLVVQEDESLSLSEVAEIVRDQQECLERALELEPEHVPALTDMADFLANNLPPNKKNNSLILSYYDKAIDLIRSDEYWRSSQDEAEFAFLGKAQFLRQIGKNSEAQKCLQEGLEIYPESELLFDELG